MAQRVVQLDQEMLCCEMCLELLKDPVTVPCGHNYCSLCIEECWILVSNRGRQSCPQCRQTFLPRPVLKKNTMLAEVVESLKKTELQALPTDQYYPGDVACDSCIGRKLIAVKTCLQCLVSYCDAHLQPHYQSPAFKKHMLVKASRKLQENICSRHNEVRKRKKSTVSPIDFGEKCECNLCSMEEQKGCDMISAAAESIERQKELNASEQNVQQRIQEKEDMKELHQEVESINRCAERAVEDSDTIFTELKASIERRQSEVRELIRDQQLREVSRAEDSKKRAEHASLSRISESTHSVSSNARPLRYFEDVIEAVSKVRDKLEDILRVDVSLSTPPEPKTRVEFLQYSCLITLDPNTAHEQLSLSKGNRKITWMNNLQSYPDHPERFTECCQVLSREGLTGRCYWEVEWIGEKIEIAVSYKDISRTGSHIESGFGHNDESWSLQFWTGGFFFTLRHSNIETDILGHVNCRVGVYLDHSAGTLSFYRPCHTMSLLHTVQTTFTQPLYAGFECWYVTAELCDLN